MMPLMPEMLPRRCSNAMPGAGAVQQTEAWCCGDQARKVPHRDHGGERTEGHREGKAKASMRFARSAIPFSSVALCAPPSVTSVLNLPCLPADSTVRCDEHRHRTASYREIPRLVAVG